MLMASSPDPHCRSTVTAGTLTGSFAVKAVNRARFPPGPTAFPRMTSSIICGSISVSSMSDSITDAPKRSGLICLNMPPTFPIAVRFACTITGVFIFLLSLPFAVLFLFVLFFLFILMDFLQLLILILIYYCYLSDILCCICVIVLLLYVCLLFDKIYKSRFNKFHLLLKIVYLFYSSIIVFYNSHLTVRSEEIFSTEQRQSIFAPNIHLLSQQQPL